MSERIAPYLREPGHVPLLIGCDCSIVVGTTQALMRAAREDVHVLYIDGDFDDATPSSERSHSAAALAVWLLTRSSPFWTGPALRPSQVTVIGWSNPSQSDSGGGVGSVSLADVRRSGPRETARRVLDAVPASSALLLHFDIDVLSTRDMPAAYFPHQEGLTLAETAELFSGARSAHPRHRGQRVRIPPRPRSALRRSTRRPARNRPIRQPSGKRSEASARLSGFTRSVAAA